jgi:uncharacterized protein
VTFLTDQALLPRHAAATLARLLAVHPVVVVTGARQTGKSTLVQSPAIGGGRLYLTLDDIGVRDDALTSPDDLVGRAPALTLDEVQRVPDLLLAIKRAVDSAGQAQAGQFIVTGSANLSLVRHVADSLAGRAGYVTLWPLTRREQLGMGETGMWTELLETPVAQWYDLVRSDVAPAEDWSALAERGGYPRAAYRLRSAPAREAWFDGYVKTYLERDVPTLRAVEHLPDFRRLLRAAALRIGNLVNQTELARDVGLPQPTVRQYLNVMEASYQVVRVPAYTVNRTTRVIKTPKLYWSDTGLALFLGGEATPRGAHLENIVLTDLLAWRGAQLRAAEILYWRSASGREVDFVIEHQHGVIPVEVKTTRHPTTRDAASVSAFLDQYAPDAAGGLLLHAGDEVSWIAKRVLAAPWWRVL